MQESKDIQHIKVSSDFCNSCGLMQESKDIQRVVKSSKPLGRCGLMQESKDIQQYSEYQHQQTVVV